MEPEVSRKCRCGNDKFTAHQITRHDVLVNDAGIYLEDRGVYDAEDPYGPFTCTQCGAEYDELEKLDQKVFTMESTNTLDRTTQEQVFTKFKLNEPSYRTIHIEWEALSDMYSELLTALLGREIKARSVRMDYYWWNIDVSDDPINQNELEALYELADFNEHDRKMNSVWEYPTTEMCQVLCARLMGRLLSLRVDFTRADDEGVWFIGTGTSSDILTKELPDGTTLIAEIWDEPDYPGIRTSLKKPDGTDEVLCFAEYCVAKPEGKQLCVCAYTRDIDEPAYYECYSDPGSSSPNV